MGRLAAAEEIGIWGAVGGHHLDSTAGVVLDRPYRAAHIVVADGIGAEPLAFGRFETGRRLFIALGAVIRDLTAVTRGTAEAVATVVGGARV